MTQKRRKQDVYFTQDTEDAIIEYNATDDPTLRNRIYTDRIKYSFEKLAEYMINTFNFPYIDMPKSDMQNEIVSILMSKIHMFKKGRGKAFSYFSVTAKYYLILENNKNYRRFKQTNLISEMPENWCPPDTFYDTDTSDEYEEFTALMLEYWDKNLTKIFFRKRDIQIADAVLELFRRSKFIESYNKKHLYLLIREMTDYKTHYITKVVSEMKKHQVTLLADYLDHGYINFRENEFWPPPPDDIDEILEEALEE